MASYTIRPEGAFALDAWLDESDTAARHGLDTTLYLGADGSDNDYFIILEFPLRAVRPGATITAATLTLYTVTNPAGVLTCAVYRLLRYNWDPVTVTWDEFIDGSSWATAGGDVSTLAPAGAAFTISPTGNATITGAAFVTVVQDSLDNRASRLLIRLSRIGAAHIAVLHSGQAADVSNAPKLELTTTETGLGYPYKGMKRVASSWITSRPDATTIINGALAVGVGTSPETDWISRHRLKSEVARVPVGGVAPDPATRSAKVWGFFDAGKGSGTFTELALFAKDTTKSIDKCDATTGWVATTFDAVSVSATRQEGTGSIESGKTGDSAGDLTRSGLSVDLRSYSTDDYLYFWFYVDTSSRLTDIAVTLTDDVGTWIWSDLQDDADYGDGWTLFKLMFGDATSSASATGPSIVSTFKIDLDNSDDVTVRVDDIRILLGSEEILAWVPVSIVKAVTDTKKIKVSFASKRGTN